jgi:hypothetical protein
LIKCGSQDYAGSIPWNFRVDVFSILKNLSNGYDPRLDGNSTFGRDFLTQAINSVRGEAVHALVDHAFWAKRHLKLSSGVLEAMPEVQSALEERLDPSHEKALAVHSVFGVQAPSLLQLDTEWFLSVRSRIFPAESGMQDRWLAAWTTYLSWNHANKLVFENLEQEYWRAVNELHLLRKEASENRPVEALGEHLIILYGSGGIPLSGERSLLEAFLSNATPAQRAHVMSYAGRALENTEKVADDVKRRLMEYWESRLDTLQRESKPDEASEELSDFAWWLRSGKLDTSWCLKQVQQLLRDVSKLPETMFFLEDIAKIARDHPMEAVVCLQLIIKRISTDRYLYMDERNVKQILNAAMSSQIPEAVKIAESAQDDLLRSGRFEFRDLTEVRTQ